MKSIKLILVSLLIIINSLYAQNQMGISIMYRTNGVVNIAASTNNPTLISVNLSNQSMLRAFINIQNTNAIPVNVYSDRLGSNLIHTVITNETYSERWPVSDNTQFYVRSSDVNSIPVTISEAWGR